MLPRQIPYSRSFTLFRMKRRWVDPLLVARGQPLALFIPRLIHATFFPVPGAARVLPLQECL